VFFTALCLRATLGIFGTTEEAFGASLSNEPKLKGGASLFSLFAEELKGEGNYNELAHLHLTHVFAGLHLKGLWHIVTQV